MINEENMVVLLPLIQVLVLLYHPVLLCRNNTTLSSKNIFLQLLQLFLQADL